jgi:hypothetical protein
MKKINLKKPLTVFGRITLDEHGKSIMLNELIAGGLAQINSGNAAKNMSIALRLYENGEVELDDVDFETFKNNLKQIRTLTDAVIYQVENEIKNQVSN